MTKTENAKARLSELANKASELDKELGQKITTITQRVISLLDEQVELFEKVQGKLDQTDELVALLDKWIQKNDSVMQEMATLRENIKIVSNDIGAQFGQLEAIADKIESLPRLSFPSPLPEDSIGQDQIDQASEEEDTNSKEAIEETARSTVRVDYSNFIAQVNNTLAMVEKAKAQLSSHKVFYGDAVYDLMDMATELLLSSLLTTKAKNARFEYTKQCIDSCHLLMPSVG